MGATGALHLGHYHGVLKSWCALQEEHDCFFMIADLAALTTHYGACDLIEGSIMNLLVDWLSAGIDPDQATIFVQSMVPEHLELAWLFGIHMPIETLERIPAFQKKIRQSTDRNLSTYGFLGDPLLQAADILLYKANLVPVGADGVAHLQLTTDIARRFNEAYARGGSPIFPEPVASVAVASPLPGTDGEKMSKSLGNTLDLCSGATTIRTRIAAMAVAENVAGANRSPATCPAFRWHEAYTSGGIEAIRVQCVSGSISCTTCKHLLAEAIVTEQEAICERAQRYLARPELLRGILEEGARTARTIARETLAEARDAMGLSYKGIALRAWGSKYGSTMRTAS